MIKATKGHEIVLKTLNEVGVMAEVAKTISEKGIDIVAVGAWTDGANGEIHLETDDDLRAMEALQKRNFQPAARKVVIVELPHRPGMLKELSERLMEAGINIEHLYATAFGRNDVCRAMLSTSDNDKAIVVLNRKEAPAARR